MSGIENRALASAAALAAVLGLVPGCRGVIDSRRHPWLTWPEVPGALPFLEALYAAEPEGLFWFAGERAHPALGGALETIARCDAVGLDPADYDAGPLATRASWASTTT